MKRKLIPAGHFAAPRWPYFVDSQMHGIKSGLCATIKATGHAVGRVAFLVRSWILLFIKKPRVALWIGALLGNKPILASVAGTSDSGGAAQPL